MISFITIYIGSRADVDLPFGSAAIFHIHTLKNHTADCNDLWASVMGLNFSHTSESLVVVILTVMNVAFISFGIRAHRRVNALWHKASGLGTSFANTNVGTTLRSAFKRLMFFLLFCSFALILHTIPIALGWGFPSLSPHWTGDCEFVVFVSWIPDILPFIMLIALLWRTGYPLEPEVGEGQRGIGLSGWNRQLRVSLLTDPESASRLLLNNDMLEDYMQTLVDEDDREISHPVTDDEAKSDLSVPNMVAPPRALTPAPILWVSVRCEDLLRQTLHQRIWEESMPTLGHVVAVHQANDKEIVVPPVAKAAMAANQTREAAVSTNQNHKAAVPANQNHGAAAAASAVGSDMAYLDAESSRTKARKSAAVPPTNWQFAGMT